MHCCILLDFSLWIVLWYTDPQTSSLYFDVRVTVHHDKFLVIKPIRCTNFWNLFLEGNSACFGQFLCLSSGVFHSTYSSGIRHTACKQDQDVPSSSCSQAVSKPVWHIPLLCVQRKTPWTEELSKTCRVSLQEQIWEINMSSWFCYKQLYIFLSVLSSIILMMTLQGQNILL
jgi:hypothetical protein